VRRKYITRAQLARVGAFKSPQAAVIGALAGTFYGLYQAINDTTDEFNKLQSSINNNVDVNTKLINNTQQYAQLQQQLVEAIREGGSERTVGNLLKQTQTALQQIGDLDVKRKLSAAGNNPDKIQEIIGNLGLRFNRQQLANDADLASFAVRQVQTRTKNFFGTEADVSGDVIKGAGLALSRASNFKSAEDIDAFSRQAFNDPRKAFDKFKKNFIEELNFGARDRFGQNASAFKAAISVFTEASKENLQIISSDDQRSLAAAGLISRNY
jgi:hypothetical protein